MSNHVFSQGHPHGRPRLLHSSSSSPVSARGVRSSRRGCRGRQDHGSGHLPSVASHSHCPSPVLHDNCHILSQHGCLPMSVGKLRPRGGVTGDRGRQVLRLSNSGKTCLVLVPAPVAQQGVSLSVLQAGLTVGCRTSLCLVHSGRMLKAQSPLSGSPQNCHRLHQERKLQESWEPKVSLRSDPVQPNYSLTEQVRALS